MTLFEYLAIATSLLLSFSVMRLVGGLPHVSQRGRRYWVHISFVCVQFLLTLVIFWVFWSFRGVVWNFPKFLLLLAYPMLIYFNACALIPENASAIESWHDYYYSIRRRYFLGQIFYILVVAGGATLLLDMPWFHPARLGQAAGLLASVVGAASENERVHSGLAVFALTVLVILGFTIAFLPGSLSP